MNAAKRSPRRYLETEPYERGFASHFEGSVRPKLSAYLAAKPEVRERLLRRRLLASLGIAGAWLGSGGYFLGTWRPGLRTRKGRPDTLLGRGIQTAGVGLVSSVAIWGVANRPVADYRAAGKRSVVGAILAFFGPVQYGQHPALGVEALQSTGLFKSFNQVNLDDALTGTRGGRAFALAEAELVRSGKSSETVFRGLILAAKLRDPIDAPVSVVPRRSWLGGLFGGTANDLKLSEMRGEHAVKGSSLEQVHRCLSPAVRKLIRQLSARAGEGNFGLCFCGDRLYVKIRQEADLLESLTDFDMAPNLADVKKLVREVHELLSFVDAVDAALDQHEAALRP